MPSTTPRIPVPGTDLVATVRQRLDASGGEPVTVLQFPADTDPAELAALLTALGQWAGRPRSLALDGFVDPTLTEELGLPLLAPFGKELVELAGWGHRGWWIGFGRITVAEATHPVVALVARPDPTWVWLPDGSSWTERLCALTGWQPVARRPAVDWAAAEAALGTALPEDYKELVELFGPGRFDEYLNLHMPGELYRSDTRGYLEWGGSEQELCFAWQTDAADPADWPIMVQRDYDVDEWERFDCGLSEFIARLLTDTGSGFDFPPSYLLDGHFFESWQR